MKLKPRQRFDKYRIDRKLAHSAFATVYQAHDTVEGIDVALKIPHPYLLGAQGLKDFLNEIRVTARLDHPNILTIKTANFIQDFLVMVYPLGLGSLADRLTRRVSFRKAMDFTGQILEALAFAHARKVLHCDVKPENFILFPNDVLRLSDFGLAKIGWGTLSASGSGTIGYVAPEQAMGRPSLASDVFSAGLLIYRMLSGTLPSWPYDWPPPNLSRITRKVHPDLIRFLRRSIEVDSRRRFPDAVRMQAAFRRLGQRKRRPRTRKRRQTKPGTWRERRFTEFKRVFGKTLETRYRCRRCGGPVSEMMKVCPWCQHQTRVYRGPTACAARCRRCGRGMKNEWSYCAMCYGGAQGPRSGRIYPNRRYAARCVKCHRPMMPFMHYCPWCRRKVRRKWPVPGTRERCSSCGWGLARDFWDYCAWCGEPVAG